VKLIRSAKDSFQFQLGRREKELFLALLKRYPCIPSAYQPLSKARGRQDPNQRLLDEALAEQRAENRKRLQALLTDPARLVEHETGWRLSLSPAELEWLLQILNDIRVGSWVILGSPAERFEVFNEETLPHLWALEMAGSFQSSFLEAMEAGEG
jgi:hypothetical protein